MWLDLGTEEQKLVWGAGVGVGRPGLPLQLKNKDIPVSPGTMFLSQCSFWKGSGCVFLSQGHEHAVTLQNCLACCCLAQNRNWGLSSTHFKFKSIYYTQL